MHGRLATLALAAALAVGGTVAAPIADTALAAKTFKNCTALNKKYPHGVGKPGARDKVRGNTKRVTNFKRSKALYNANKGKDRDKDGIACEKR